jgi:pilus assembly protein CpaE
MYPLKTVLVNFPEPVVPPFRVALEENDASIEAMFPDVNSAIEKWAWNDHDARLVLFYIAGLQHVHDLKCLKRAFNWPIVAVLEAPREQLATLLILANRAGAAQVVAMPLDVDDFRAGLDAICREHGFHGTEARSVAVAGVTGGCGATTIAINLADCAAAYHRGHCVLVELALQKGMLATYLNVEPRFVLPDLLQPGLKIDQHLIRQALTKIRDNFDIVSGAHFQITPGQFATADVLRLIEHLQRTADVLVLDVPWTADDHFVQTLSTANQVVLVAEQNLPSLRSLKLVMDMLSRSELTARAGGLTVEIVVNRYDPRSKDFPVDRIKEVLEAQTLVTVANDYPAVNASVNSGVPLRLGAPKSKAHADLVGLTHKLFGTPEPSAAPPASDSGRWNLFGRLARVFSGSSA